MRDPGVETLRGFNRLVTQRIGALEEEYLGGSRPLGASRVLWEIGDECDVLVLRTRLDLDSGYLSRLLRSLEKEGLVKVAVDPDDARRRIARLTRSGRRERDRLDSDSDELAWSMLAPLSQSQRERLVNAAATVQRLLTAGMVTVEPEDAASEDARFCITSYFDELDDRFEDGFDPDLSISADVDELTPPAGLLLLARLRGEPIGCGALKFHDDAPTEIKRMWVSTTARGLGLGRRLLTELEAQAAAFGATTVRLETNRSLGEAINLYRSAGYREVDAFNDEPFAHHWFEKPLVPSAESDPPT